MGVLFTVFIFIFIFGIYMLIRNCIVYDFRRKISKSDIFEYMELPSYDRMMVSMIKYPCYKMIKRAYFHG